MTATVEAMAPVAACVSAVEKETRDTFTLTVSVEAGNRDGPQFQPGQFSMIYAFGVGELPISISSDPEVVGEQRYTIRSVGQATNALVHHRVGDVIGLRGPFGRGWPVERARGKDVLLVAGGIGLAPLRPVIYYVMRHRADFRRLIIIYGARTPADLLFRRELAKWSRQPETQVLTTVDYGGVRWRGHVGVVTQLFKRVRLDPPNTVAFSCGPEVMMRYAAAEIEDRGVGREEIYVSLERNMKCGIGWCGHCQLAPHFVCKDGPVFSYGEVADWMTKYEV
jgi:NAD(P)H-flavin reductase